MSRYVCINTFFDESAAGHVCRPVRGSTEPAGKFPQELRQGLAPELRGLLDWEVPGVLDSQARLLRRMRGEQQAAVAGGSKL